MLIDAFLPLLGVQRWSLRRVGNQKLVYCYPLADSNGMKGFLLIEDKNRLAPLQAKPLHLVNEILNAINLKLMGEGKPATESILNQLESAPLIIAMGDSAALFIKARLKRVAGTLVTVTPETLLATPIHKKELWEKLRNFT